MRNFKNLKIWSKGFELATSTYHFVSTFPKEGKYGIVSQITRAAVSIPSNIAEGCSRKSAKDFCRFLEISLGSAFELETQMLIAQSANFGDRQVSEQLLIDIEIEQKMLTSYINKLNN